jgi:hypothetical protein
MGKEMSVGVHMQKLDDIVVSDDTATAGFWEGLGGNDLPVVVGVIVTISSHLLTCEKVSLKTFVKSSSVTNLGC